MLFPAMIVAGAVLTTAMSADVLTVVLAVLVLFPGVGSVVVVVTVAVLESVLPLVVPALTVATTLNVAVAPAFRVERELVMLLPILLKVNAGPAVCDCETKVVPAGRLSA